MDYWKTVFAAFAGCFLGVAAANLMIDRCLKPTAPDCCTTKCPPDCGPRLEKLERVVFKTGAEQPE